MSDLLADTPPPVEPVVAERGQSLSDKAYHLLRHKILRGEIPPEGKLKMETLQREHALSSSPLREALNRLLAEGLVQSDDHRGFRAAPMSAPDLRDITDFRLMIEPVALEESIRRGTDEWEAGIIGAFHRLERTESRLAAAERATSEEWTERHKGFHMALIARCPSSRMTATCSGLFDLSERYRRFSATHRKEPRDTTGEHRQLMDAALARDVPGARDLLRSHITRTAENVIANLHTAG
jgi:DNA-binding GntR family transcriptional regulator